MRAAVIIFPGSTDDLAVVASEVLTGTVDRVWYKDTNLLNYDLVLLSGGFSYGDYLRAGALASRTDILTEVKRVADKERLVLGIGNGFQILLEAGLLPGVLLENQDLDFIHKNNNLIVRNNRTPFTHRYHQNEVISLPIAHENGRYHCDDETLETLQKNNQIIFQYQDNPNGSLEDIAGITNQTGNVLGMMPHPERATSTLFGNEAGLAIFQSIIDHWRKNHDANA